MLTQSVEISSTYTKPPPTIEAVQANHGLGNMPTRKEMKALLNGRALPLDLILASTQVDFFVTKASYSSDGIT